LQARAERLGLDSGAIYRLMSPVFWIGQMGRGFARLARRIVERLAGAWVGAVAALVLAVKTAILSGWAQALFGKLPNR
jgi:hypothetical protein